MSRRRCAILDAAYEAGITFIDTADVYPLGGGHDTVGRTEEIVGTWLAAYPGRRDDVVLATKCVGSMGDRPWQSGASRRHVVEAVDASLRRLGVERIDLYQLHSPDPETPIDETLQALDDLVRAGKVGYVGCSNFLAYQVARAIGRSEALGLARFDSLQPRYNLLFRQIERELLPLAAEESIGVIPYNPIAGGMLTGKHRRGAPDRGHPLHARLGAGSLPGSLLERRGVRHGRGVGAARRRGRCIPDHARRLVGARESARHGADHRCEPARAARRLGRRTRAPARRRPKARLDDLTAHRLGDAAR